MVKFSADMLNRTLGKFGHMYIYNSVFPFDSTGKHNLGKAKKLFLCGSLNKNSDWTQPSVFLLIKTRGFSPPNFSFFFFCTGNL